jgi:penicillin amidase
MRAMASRVRRIAGWLALGIALLLLIPLVVVYAIFRASLPDLDGTFERAGLKGPVWIERDALGIPTIEGLTRTDVAYATGFVHAQDRFFQMDLSRRLAAGELSELFGEIAEPQDARARPFRFREVAGKVLEQATPEERALIEAYSRGVNDGLRELGSRPWEYWLLRAEPTPWLPEDSILVAHAMWWDLQYSGIRREIVRRMIEARAPQALCFLYPDRTSWDSPNSASLNATDEADPAAPSCEHVPPPEVLNVRASNVSDTALRVPQRADAPGSNNWAVSGKLTASGAALVANDMHLNLRVPNVWYRARLRVAAADPDDVVDLNGVTLAGAPLLIAGSNGRIAWGYTNSYGDWLDVTRAPCGASNSELGALVAEGPEAGDCWYVHWLATIPEATNLRLLALEKARSVDDALALAPQMGIPHQNAVIGDHEGHIAWTIFGRIPRATDATRNTGRAAWTDVSDHPRIVDPPIGFLWTANARPSDNEAHVRAIAADEGDFELGARARQIRDGLARLQGNARASDMLAIQLDDRSLFLRRWHELLLQVLDEGAVSKNAARAELRRVVAELEPRASVDAVAYRLVRTFHDRTERAVWQMILTALNIPTDQAAPPAEFEQPLWTLITERPLHMLAPQYSDWRAFLLAQVDGMLEGLRAPCPDLSRCTWGSRRPVQIRHPLSAGVPFLSWLLDMPTVELPGDHDMPRVQNGAFGASERFAISPGHEADSYLNIAGGQSGHPLSPFYRAGFREWAEGKPLPLLPGKAEHRLVLAPR